MAVAGFGMLAHAYEVARGSGERIELRPADLAFIREAVELAKIGILPEGMYRNRTFAEAGVDVGEIPLWQQDLMYDPQTAGDF